MRLTGLFVAYLFAVLLLTASPVEAQETHTITVFAAASLTDALTEVAEAFEAENPDVEVLFSFGSSSSLATQLAEGAVADVFASANARQMEVVRGAGRIEEPVEIFVRNRLVIAIPADNPASVQSLSDLARPGVLLVLAAREVPVRVYTDAMFEALTGDPRYGESYREAVFANVASEEENVRQVVAKIALGEADAGVVYQSDITPDVADDVLAIVIPDEFNQVATYPIATVSDSGNPVLAREFVNFVLSDAGQAILIKWGFMPTCPDDRAVAVTPEARNTEIPESLETAGAAGCE